MGDRTGKAISCGLNFRQEGVMKKILVVFLLLITAFAFSGMAMAGGSGHVGPAPNSGDGNPDGSGFESPPYGPNDSGAGEGDACGPAPNSGDGIPDGSGFDCPNDSDEEE